MRLTRRAALGTLAFAAGFGPARAEARPTEPTPIEVSSTPIRSFSPREPDRVAFGALRFRGGLRLSSRHAQFGGFSGLARPGDGARIVALLDQGYWLTGRLDREGGRPSGLSDTVLAPVLGANGRPVWRTRGYDTESLSITDGIAHVGVERTHEVLRFDWAREGVNAKARPLPVPREVKRLPNNRGLEAIGVAPAGTGMGGAIVAIAERSGARDEPTLGVILGGPRPGLFRLARHDDFHITDLAFLPDGTMLVLERFYAPLSNVGVRLRRVRGRDVVPGALVDGERIFEADLGEEIDNMEALSVHQEAGRTILTLMSDDNFSPWQRTLLLEFELAG